MVGGNGWDQQSSLSLWLFPLLLLLPWEASAIRHHTFFISSRWSDLTLINPKIRWLFAFCCRLPIPRPGEVLGLVGTNGIGKSTALKILAGKQKPNLGRFDVGCRTGCFLKFKPGGYNLPLTSDLPALMILPWVSQFFNISHGLITTLPISRFSGDIILKWNVTL